MVISDDYHELLTEAIAPRPTMLYTPTSDRDATYADVSAAVNASRSQPSARLSFCCTPLSLQKIFQYG